MAAELLEEEAAERKAAEKEVAPTKGKGKKMKPMAASAATAAAPLASTPSPAVAEEWLPVCMFVATIQGDARGVAAWLWTRAEAWTRAAQSATTQRC